MSNTLDRAKLDADVLIHPNESGGYSITVKTLLSEQQIGNYPTAGDAIRKANANCWSYDLKDDST